MINKTVRIADSELGLLFYDGMFQKVLEPGSQKISRWNNRPVIHKIDLRPLLVQDHVLDTLWLTHPAVVEANFEVANIGDNQIGLVFAEGKLVDVVGSGQVVFYANRLREVAVQVLDATTEFEVPKELVAPLAQLKRPALVSIVEVPSENVGLLFVDGVLERQLTPGRYAFYKAARQINVAILDLRLQTFEVTGQEVLTKDRIGVRTNITAVYRIVDPIKAVTVTADLRDYLYKELQFALRQVVGTQTLDEILVDKQGINAALAERLLPNLGKAGLEVPTVGVKDIILPGDVRELMNRVIEAEKVAQATVIKRREETAVTRALLNTAKLMEDNPILLRLKELEALEKVSEKIGNVIVGNGMDGVREDLVRIKPRVT